jgi:hypothetical protein
MKVILSLLFLAMCIFAKGDQRFLTPTKGDVEVYKNATHQTSEKPIAVVGLNDRLTILGKEKQSYKIKVPTGEIGWVDVDLVIVSGKSKTFIFDNAEVVGYLDNPTPVYIIDADNPNSDPIKLDRSFADALRENVDHETADRLVK